MDWLDFLAVQGTLKSLLQHHSSKASILLCSALFIVQLSHPCMTTGKTIALTRRTFVDKVMSLLFNMLSRLVITFLPRSKHLLISWLQSPGDTQNSSVSVSMGSLDLVKSNKYTCPLKNLYTAIYSSFILKFQNLKATKMLLSRWRIHKLGYIQATRHYSALKRNELVSHEKICKNF